MVFRTVLRPSSLTRLSSGRRLIMSLQTSQKPPFFYRQTNQLSSTPTKPIMPSGTIDKIRDMWKKYGVVSIGTYMGIYVATLGTMYVAVDHGLLTPSISKQPKSVEKNHNEDEFDLVQATNRFVRFAEKLGVAELMDVHRVDSKTGSFVLAWVATKFTEPLRFALTLAVTPRIARFLGRAPKKVTKA